MGNGEKEEKKKQRKGKEERKQRGGSESPRDILEKMIIGENKDCLKTRLM